MGAIATFTRDPWYDRKTPVRPIQKKGYRRYKRVGESLQQVIAEAIERKVDDPRIGFVTVTLVDAAPDLKTAKVYVSVLGGDAEQHKAAVAALEEHAGVVQREIARHMRLMWTPKLRFFVDDTPARADRIERILHQTDDGPDPEPMP